MLFVGNDWAEAHHDVELVDDPGRCWRGVGCQRAWRGWPTLHGLIADHLGEGDEPDQVLVGIETDRGPWVQALIAAGYTVYPINPLQVGPLPRTPRCGRSEVRSGRRHVLAEIVRLDRAHHRPAAGDSAVAEGCGWRPGRTRR